MAKALTVMAIEAMRPPASRREIPDGSVVGLYLVVQATGTKSWAVRYRSPDGKPRKLTLGNYPQVGLAKARTLAVEALTAVDAGSDPAADKRNVRTDPKADPEARERVEAVVADFLAREVSQRPKSAKENERLLRMNVLPHWSGRPIHTITKRDVIDVLNRVVDRGSPVAANRVYSILSKFFNWCVATSILDRSPMEGTKPPTREQSRDRVLTDGEIGLIWKAAEEQAYPFGPILQLLILTGQRRGEVGEARWLEFDLDGGSWTIPAARSKNGRPNTVPLSPLALTILRGLPRTASPFLFTTTGSSPVSGFSNAKEEVDRIVADLAGEGIEPWRLHDVRRTVATGLARANVPPHVVESILNHRSGVVSGVAAIYNRYEYSAEKKLAMDDWSKHIEDLTK